LQTRKQRQRPRSGKRRQFYSHACKYYGLGCFDPITRKGVFFTFTFRSRTNTSGSSAEVCLAGLNRAGLDY
jgi:hypothetical protein